MNERAATRLHVAAGLTTGAALALAPEQAHRVRHVLRLAVGDAIAAFNGAEGEWLCRIVEAGRAGVRVEVERRLRPLGPEGDLWLLFAPIKRLRLDWLVEKATELGVSALLPVWTARTQVERLNLERLQGHAIAAAEQSGRLSVPQIRPPEGLARILAQWPAGRQLVVCDERGRARPAPEALAALPTGPAALLVGPEGGFAETELDPVLKLPFVTGIGLGPRVLRAETAVVAALALFQALAGDWRRTRPH